MVFFIIIGVIIAADLLSKEMIKDRIEEGQKKELVKDRLYFWRIKNTGCAYSVMKDKPDAVVVSSSVVTAIIGGVLCAGIAKGEKPSLLAGLSMCLGGALGNLIDRIKNKGVTDFIYVNKKKMPIFNLADIFIFVGVITVIIALLSKDN